MGRLATIGFELNSLTGGVEFEYVTVGCLSIQGTTVRSGSYALKALPSNNYGYVGIQTAVLVAGRTYKDRVYLRIKTSFSAASPIIDREAGGGAAAWRIVLNTNDTLQLTDGAGTNIGSASPALPKDNFENRIEISYAYIGGACSARLNGVEFASGTATPSIGAYYLWVGVGLDDVNVASGEIYFDDIAINNDQGTYQNSWPGSGKVIYRRPSGAGESAQWLRAGTDSGANWSQCNSRPPDDAAAYVRSTTLNALDMYAITNFGLDGTETVNVVEVGVRFCRSASVSPGFKVRLVKTAGGTQALSAEITPDSDTWRTNANAVPRTSPIIAYLDPDGQPWTPIGTLDSLQAGVVETTDTTRYAWVTEIWVTVDYTPVEATAVSISDAGAGSDSPLSGKGLIMAQTGAGADVALAGKGLIMVETSSGADVALRGKAFVLGDAGSGVDAALRGKILAILDTGGGVDQALAGKGILLVETAVGQDAVVVVEIGITFISIIDSAIGIDFLVLNKNLLMGDAGFAWEEVKVEKPALFSDYDYSYGFR
jgi:hypothetical protein